MKQEKLVSLAKTDDKVRAVFSVLGSRERPRGTTDLRRLRYEISSESGMSLSTLEIRDIFRAIEKAGFGKLVLRKQDNDPDRFVWNTNYVNLGHEVTSGAVGGGPAQDRNVQYVQKTGESKARCACGGDCFEVVFPIRGKIYDFCLPRDLTVAEATKLADFIRQFGS